MNREKVYLVNKDDVVVDEKWRDELSDDDCWRIIGVWVTDQNGNILLQQRSLNKKISPGLWSPVCEGTVVKGDSYKDTAIRELQEELGITNSNIQDVTKKYIRSSLGWRIDQTYHCVIDRSTILTPQASEVEQIQWFTPEELLQKMINNPEEFVIPHLWKELFRFS